MIAEWLVFNSYTNPGNGMYNLYSNIAVITANNMEINVLLTSKRKRSH